MTVCGEIYLVRQAVTLGFENPAICHLAVLVTGTCARCSRNRRILSSNIRCVDGQLQPGGRKRDREERWRRSPQRCHPDLSV